MSSIRLSPKHGVNPSIMQCFYCGGDAGVALPGLLKGDKAAPRKAVWDMEPCAECKKLLAEGVMLIEADESKSSGDLHNPYRTGCMAVMTDAAVSRIFDTETAARLLKRRVGFLSIEAWDQLGLPRENKDYRGKQGA